MITTMPVPAGLPGHVWRPLRREDAPALHQLELECVPTDGGTSLNSVEDHRKELEGAGEKLTTDTLCASDSAGRLAASAWVTCDLHLKHEYRAFLDGRVHPDYRGRGLGSFLLSWMEARACQILSALEQDRPAMPRIDFYDRSEDAVALFEEHGFHLASAEDTMRRDLSHALPDVQLPEGMTLVTWSPQCAAIFFEVYQDAFRKRPGFPNWSEDTWRHNFTDYPDFRADLSLLAMEGTEGVGFTICHAENEGDAQSGGTGWVSQMGVRPAWRERGVGGALLSEVMRRFQASGLGWAALDVSTENRRALRVYQRLGFERYRRRTSFQKPAVQGCRNSGGGL